MVSMKNKKNYLDSVLKLDSQKILVCVSCAVGRRFSVNSLLLILSAFEFFRFNVNICLKISWKDGSFVSRNFNYYFTFFHNTFIYTCIYNTT